MTESLPRGNFGPGPVSVPSISWFEFLLNETLLETHLNLENPELKSNVITTATTTTKRLLLSVFYLSLDPSAYQLIIQFLQQADSHLAATTPDKPPTTQIGVNGETVKEETSNQETKVPVKENRKVTALKLLALKVTAFLNWNLTKLMKSVPLVMIHSMLNDLCRRTMDCDLESICNSSIDFQSISPQAAFTIQLYHRFCILSVIKDSFPVRPVKTFVQMQGQVEPMIALAGANDLLVRNIRDRITMSVVNLEKCVECGKSIIMPSLQCIELPKEDSDGLDIRWEDGITILPNEYNCQLYYDLGCFYFYQEAYSQAYVMFQRTKELLKELESPTYCSIDATRLNGYYTGCRSLQGVSDMSVVNMETMYEQAEAARKNNYQELSTMYRSDIEDEIANQGDRYNVLYIQVSICNVIRGVMEGKALVSLLANVLEDCDKETTDFLLMLIT
ncbi:hypothetical protein KUTeg_019120 [Tegillarca granosa]|uniref:Integrator complex subunit 8 n=1 Tax=Tegillarca granosa TaxID=220873 RepID=A0ABQ9EBK8_TEGGR|nr:hypothetical protein KUTeg_019120 [Tegillarca granosa]